MNFIEELDNQNNNIQKEIDAHIPEIELVKRFIKYIKEEIKKKMSNKQRFLRGFPFYCPDCYWIFHEVASKGEAVRLLPQEYYATLGKLKGDYLYQYGDDSYKRYINHTIDIPCFEKKLYTELISLGCKVNKAEVLSGTHTGQRKREKKTLFGYRTITEYYPYESFVIYIDIEW